MNNLKNKIKNMKGITLIALIITIIVLLILAGVVINMTMGNDGIISKAQGAVDMYKNAQEKEEYEIAKSENEIDSYISGNRDYATEINKLKAEIASLKNANSCSTTEKIIGTWINNKPLYKKTIIIENVNTSWQLIDLSSYFDTSLDTIELLNFNVKRWYNKDTNSYYIYGYNFMNPSTNSDKMEILVSLNKIVGDSDYNKPMCYLYVPNYGEIRQGFILNSTIHQIH